MPLDHGSSAERSDSCFRCNNLLREYHMSKLGFQNDSDQCLTAGRSSIGLIVIWGVGHENVTMDLDLKVSTPTWAISAAFLTVFLLLFPNQPVSECFPSLVSKCFPSLCFYCCYSAGCWKCFPSLIYNNRFRHDGSDTVYPHPMLLVWAGWC